LEGCGIVLESQVQFSHRVVAVPPNEVGSGTVRKVDLLGKVLHSPVVFVDTLVANTSVVQILQVLGVGFESHGVIGNGLMEESNADVAVSAVGITLAAGATQFNFL
jgi:hypothetical protein